MHCAQLAMTLQNTPTVRQESIYVIRCGEARKVQESNEIGRLGSHVPQLLEDHAWKGQSTFEVRMSYERYFLDDYVSMAALDGKAFSIDSADVHTFIVSFIAGNDTAETKIQAYEGQNNGRLDFIALREHYEGVGLHTLDITKAETILNS
jgi:hypothetical protein